jgi:hypothetical protein
MTPQQVAENDSIDVVRKMLTEELYCSLGNTFQTVNHIQQQKLFLNRPNHTYVATHIVHNFRSCVRNTNNTVAYFRKKLLAWQLQHLPANAPMQLHVLDLPTPQQYANGDLGGQHRR